MKKQRPSPLQEAEAYLRDLLAEGPVAVEKVLQGAKEAGIPLQTLYAAKRALGLSTTRRDGQEWWG